MKRLYAVLLTLILLTPHMSAMEPLKDGDIDISAPYAVLMEKSTGTVLYEKNAHEKMPPASVTKVMTMLLIVEQLENGSLSEDDMVITSKRAASMGGSQIFLEEGEKMCVKDMLKSIAVSSANDCSVAMAEHIAGSEEAFVAKMNTRAAELGMNNTHFTNCSGLLENESHLTTAYDIALMSRELISHDRIKEYTTIWMDSVRDGKFGLSNTNKLIYYYDGATGLKTGFTAKAMYCLSATAMRDGVEYIAVIMHGATSNERFDSAKALFNYAFANFTLIPLKSLEVLPPISVKLGTADAVQPQYSSTNEILVERSVSENVNYSFELPTQIKAPVEKGQNLGSLNITSGTELIAKIPIVASDDVSRINKLQLFTSLLSQMSGV